MLNKRVFNFKFSSGLWVLLAFSATVIFAACNPQSSTTPPTPSSTTPAKTAASSPGDVLKLLYWQAPTILNPHLSTGFKDSEASRITLEPLASFDKNGQLIPFLAAEIPTRENGGIAKDGKSITWKLKPNIKWSDGKPFTAEDVVFTYQFVTNPKTGSSTADNYKGIQSVKAIAPHTVKITFNTVNPAWSLYFVGGEGMILPRHAYAAYDGAKAREAPANLLPIGTGPYKVVEFKPGDTVVYEPNPLFRRADRLGFKRIELKGGGDATSAARAVLQTGDADYAYNLQVESKVLDDLAKGDKGKLVSNLGSLSERILFNQTDPNKATDTGERSSLKYPHPFFTDPKVREAFTLAIDRDAIAKQLYGLTGKATSNYLLLPQEFYSPNTSYEFNPQKAIALLEAAGWKDSNNDGTRDKKGQELQIVFQTSVNPLRQKTQEIVKQGLKAIGVGVELKSIDASIFFSSDPSNPDTVGHFYADLQMYTSGNTSPDPATYMQGNTCKSIPQKANQWSGNNYARYCNPAYDKLWQQASQELDPQKRAQLFIQMNDLLVKNFIVVPLVHRADVAAIGNSLQGFDLTPWDRNTWNIQDWKRG